MSRKDRSYGKSQDKVYSEYTFIEKLLPPFGTYIIRKLALVVIVFLFSLGEWIGRRFDMEVSVSVSDRSEWVWLEDVSLPRYGVKRKD